MLDAITLERGIPTASVITALFVSTAEATATLNGMPGYPVAVVPHPFGSLTADLVRARADAVVTIDRARRVGIGTSARHRPGIDLAPVVIDTLPRYTGLWLPGARRWAAVAPPPSWRLDRYNGGANCRIGGRPGEALGREGESWRSRDKSPS